MRIHAIQTGTVAIRPRQREGVGRGRRRLLNMYIDREWTEPLPIFAYAIEHPEGVVVVDTGETARVSEPGYFPRWHPYYRFGVRMWVEPEQEIGPQLQRLGIGAGDVRRVVLTHLHTDHAGGLRHFQASEILVTRTELAGATGTAGKVRGFLPQRWPAWFAPTLVDFEDRPFGPFPRSRPLTEGGDVVLLPTPGHTPGHQSVAVRLDDALVVLAGDASYAQALMLAGAVDGVSPDERVARVTLARLRALAEREPTVYLPAHDPDVPRRLAALEPAVPVRPEAVATGA